MKSKAKPRGDKLNKDGKLEYLGNNLAPQVAQMEFFLPLGISRYKQSI
jgi:hypothetical protein